MLVLNHVLGNTKADEMLRLSVQRKEKLHEVEYVELAFHDASRRRLRVTTSAGQSVGIDLGDAEALRDGDVLIGEDPGLMFVVNVAPTEAMALRMSKKLPADELFEFGVRLGHMLGNQHWPLKVEHDVVYTPLTIDKKVMETVVKTHGFDGLVWEFVPVEPGDVPSGMPHIHHEH